MLTYELTNTTLIATIESEAYSTLVCTIWDEAAPDSGKPTATVPGTLAHFDLGHVVAAMDRRLRASEHPSWWQQVRGAVDEDWTLRED